MQLRKLPTLRTPAVLPLFAMMLLPWLASCDAGKHHDQKTQGPPLRVLANTNPAAANGRVEVAFDRLIHPATINTASIQVTDASGQVVKSSLRYDPFTRVVSLAAENGGSAWLTEGQTYHIKIRRPQSDDDVVGLRAFDRAPVENDEDFPFNAGPAQNVVDEPIMDFCADVQPLFNAKCGGSTCHSSTKTPPITSGGLVLTNPQGVAHTAISRASIESNKGLRAGGGGPPGSIFGIDMPIIDPKNPGNSWLVYKLSLTPPAGVVTDTVAPSSCGPPAVLTPSTLAKPITDDERERLGSFVEGQSMPYPTFNPDGSPIFSPFGPNELARIRLWIEQGAIVRSCTCQ